MSVSRERVMEILRDIRDPDKGQDIVSLGMIENVHVFDDSRIVVTILVDPKRGQVLEPLRQQVEAVVRKHTNAHKVTAVLTAERTAADQKSSTQKRATHDPHGMEKNPRLELPIRKIIAVASGKGGVGKSTIAVNLSVALAQAGHKTGLLDADIYGPSMPMMMGLEGQKPEQEEDGKIIPLEAHGLKVMSIGFMLKNKEALIWRGPMVQTALYQLLRDVAWGTEDDPLDFLIVDMPPGTGDAQLTLAQKVPVSGAVIVSTPQDIALIDARKAVEMFRKTDVPVLGLIENMSTHICSNCGHEEHIFGHGGARKEAEALGVPFLGEVPLDMAVRESGDHGAPVLINTTAREKFHVFNKIANIILKNA